MRWHAPVADRYRRAPGAAAPVLLLALGLALPGPSAVADSATEVVAVAAVHDGRPAPGYVAEPDTISSGCPLGLPEVADHIYACESGAAPTARVCWTGTDPALLCLADPAAPDNRRLQRVLRRSPLPPPVNLGPRRPFTMTLDDDTRCTAVRAAPDSPDTDDWPVDYACTTASGPVALARTADGRLAIDQGAPVWTVRLAGAEQSPRPVRTAWIAVTD